MKFSALALAFFTLWACEGADSGDLFGSPSTGGSGGPVGGAGGTNASGGTGTTGSGGSSGVTGSGGKGGSEASGGKGGAGGTSGGSAGTGGDSAGTGGTDGGSAGTGGATGGSAGTGAGGEGGTPAEPQGGAGGVEEPSCDHAEVCDGRDNDCDGKTDPIGTCPAGCDGFAGQDKGHGYMVCEVGPITELTSALALTRCQTESPDMHLAWLETESESDFVRDITDDVLSGAVWIGGSDSDTEGAWSWAPGGSSFWDQSLNDGAGAAVGGQEPQWDTAQGQPNNMTNVEPDGEDCVVLESSGLWNDVRCGLTSIKGMVCEIED